MHDAINREAEDGPLGKETDKETDNEKRGRKKQ